MAPTGRQTAQQLADRGVLRLDGPQDGSVAALGSGELIERWQSGNGCVEFPPRTVLLHERGKLRERLFHQEQPVHAGLLPESFLVGAVHRGIRRAPRGLVVAGSEQERVEVQVA